MARVTKGNVVTKGGQAYTQTYTTADRVHPAATAGAVAATAATNVAPFGYLTAAQADAIPIAVNAIEADLLVVKKLVNALIDDLQAKGLAA